MLTWLRERPHRMVLTVLVVLGLLAINWLYPNPFPTP